MLCGTRFSRGRYVEGSLTLSYWTIAEESDHRVYGQGDRTPNRLVAYPPRRNRDDRLSVLSCSC